MAMSKEPDAETTRLMDTIRATRKDRRIFVKDAAARIGMDRTYWSALEHGRFLPAVRTLARMADAIGCHLEVVDGRVAAPEPVDEAQHRPAVDLARYSRVGKYWPNLLRVMGRVRAAREAQGISQAQAAARAGIVKGTWGHLERGYVSGRDVGIERVSAAARAVGLRVDAVAEHHVPLLELDADEVAKVRGLIRWYRDNAPGSAQFDSIADKLELDAPSTLDKAA